MKAEAMASMLEPAIVFVNAELGVDATTEAVAAGALFAAAIAAADDARAAEMLDAFAALADATEATEATEADDAAATDEAPAATPEIAADDRLPRRAARVSGSV